MHAVRGNTPESHPVPGMRQTKWGLHPLSEKGEFMFWHRVLRAARLEAALYEEVEADETSMLQAMAVVLLSSVAAGLATYDAAGLTGLIGGTAASLISWYVWAYVTYLIGTRLLPGPNTSATHGELLRTLGFSSAPGLIRGFGVYAPLAAPLMLASAIWMLMAMVVAVRQALDYDSTWRAIGVCLVGWLLHAMMLVVTLYAISLLAPTPGL